MKKKLSKMLLLLVISCNLLNPMTYVERPQTPQAGYFDVATFSIEDEMPHGTDPK